MTGFDGDEVREAALREALVGLLAVFPEHLPKRHHPEGFEPAELLRNDRFDAIVRAHRNERLALPIEALRSTGAPHDAFDRMPARRFAWFVPSLLASWLDGAPSRTRDRFGANEIEAVAAGVDVAWTDEEAAALEAFFVLALDAALSTPLRPAREPLPRTPPGSPAGPCRPTRG